MLDRRKRTKWEVFEDVQIFNKRFYKIGTMLSHENGYRWLLIGESECEIAFFNALQFLNFRLHYGGKEMFSFDFASHTINRKAQRNA